MVETGKEQKLKEMNDADLFKVYTSNERTESEKLEARNELIVRQSDNAEKAAWSHFKWKNSCGVDDLIQEAWKGIMKSIDKYDPSYNVPFKYYSYQWADAYVRYSIYSKGRTIRTPIPKIRALAQIKSAVETLKEKLGREPSVQELSTLTGHSPKKIEKILGSEVHLFSTAANTENDNRECSIKSSVVSPSKAYETKECNAILRKLIYTQLDALEQKILINRMGLFGVRKKTLHELSEETNYTKPGVRMVEHRAMDKLKLAYNRFEEGMITI